MEICRRKNHSKTVLIFVLLMTSFTLNHLSVRVSGVEPISLTLAYYDDWIPGNSFGFPGYVNTGNFTSREKDEILLISSIPEKTDVITLCYYNEGNLSADISLDCDYSKAYQSCVGDFDGNGDLELFSSEEWSVSIGNHLGSQHKIYDVGDFTFIRNTSFYYSNPNAIIDRVNVFDYNSNGDDEIILATWDSDKKSELIRIYDYENNGDLVQITNISHAITSEDFYFRTTVFVGIGDLTGNSSREIITVSQWNTESNPSVFSSSYDLYSLNENTNNISHISTGLLNIIGTSVTVDITDMNHDSVDELLIYYDKTYSPKLVLYDLTNLAPIEKNIIIRSQSSYPNSGWFCNTLLISDLNNDSTTELIFSELNLDFEGNYIGRYEIYSYKNNVIESVLLQEIYNPPIASAIADVDETDDLELVSVFNDYSLENFLTKGGMEVWTVGYRSSGKSSISDNIVEIILLFTLPIILPIFSRKRKI